MTTYLNIVDRDLCEACWSMFTFNAVHKHSDNWPNNAIYIA